MVYHINPIKCPGVVFMKGVGVLYKATANIFFINPKGTLWVGILWDEAILYLHFFAFLLNRVTSSRKEFAPLGANSSLKNGPHWKSCILQKREAWFHVAPFCYTDKKPLRLVSQYMCITLFLEKRRGSLLELIKYYNSDSFQTWQQ